MNFSICIIVKNEANTLPKCIKSLKPFMKAGGAVCVVDTGSTDGTASIARTLGCKVREVGNQFVHKIGLTRAKEINHKFVKEKEPKIVKAKDTLFHFAEARNFAASIAPTDMVIAVDGDEFFIRLDYDAINKLIDEGHDQFITPFIFARDDFGKPAIEFEQCRFYNKKKVEYAGIVHEVPEGKAEKQIRLSKEVFQLEHGQEKGKQHRRSYLAGLALDCYENPNKDRQSHYFARELLYTGRHKSAIAEFERHIEMDGWDLEKAQSMIFIGDCYGRLNKPEEQAFWYHKSFYFNSKRREALIKLAEFYRHNNNKEATAAYATAALALPKVDYYANDQKNYSYYPHTLLYWALGWIGDIEGAKYHISKALEYEPINSTCLRDLRFYYDLPMVSIIIPTLGRKEGLERCLTSIQKLNYPEEKIETIVIEDIPRIGVPKRVKEGYAKSKGDYICYGSNDIEFTPDSMILAVWDAMSTGCRLVAFDTGVRNTQGYICEHFIMKRSLVEDLGEIFSEKLNHYCVDDLLWLKAEKTGDAMVSKGFINHYHYSRIGSGQKKDAINDLAIKSYEKDTKIYKEELKKLKFTGERVVPDDMKNAINVMQDHIARYNFALEYVKDKTVVDAACGTGYGCSLMSKVAANVIGIDKDELTITYARDHYKGAFYLMDLDLIENWTSAGWDVITSFETIEHLENPDKFLRWAADHCEKFIFSIPINDDSEFHKHVWNIEEIKKLISKYFTNPAFYSQERMNFYYEVNGSATYVVGVAQGNIKKGVRNAVQDEKETQTT
jgi:glycosyltransferase involved in cell wall biosynthesis